MIHVDADDPTPPYEQIRAGLAREIRSGRASAGHRLPSVRQLAGDLRVAPGTVARAYRELEEAGMVATRGSQGTVVREGWASGDEMSRAASAFVDEVRCVADDLEDVIDAVRQAWSGIEARATTTPAR
ncbi:GntR family transcriptional regulator [Marisediminicola sp. LYQ134]|uniref:GntR family transcriptional regulator n=1 Tax=Marisediminicola sp. LYQ134 TaxID=3391061 RepID=UPI0039838FDA